MVVSRVLYLEDYIDKWMEIRLPHRSVVFPNLESNLVSARHKLSPAQIACFDILFNT